MKLALPEGGLISARRTSSSAELVPPTRSKQLDPFIVNALNNLKGGRLLSPGLNGVPTCGNSDHRCPGAAGEPCTTVPRHRLGTGAGARSGCASRDAGLRSPVATPDAAADLRGLVEAAAKIEPRSTGGLAEADNARVPSRHPVPAGRTFGARQQRTPFSPAPAARRLVRLAGVPQHTPMIRDRGRRGSPTAAELSADVQESVVRQELWRYDQVEKRTGVAEPRQRFFEPGEKAAVGDLPSAAAFDIVRCGRGSAR